MPVTKKKGAIFAIYTDSPARSTRSQVHNQSPSTSISHPLPPIKKAIVSRKALSTVQPKILGFPSEPLSKLEKGKSRAEAIPPIKSSEKSLIPSVNPKSSARTTSSIPKRIPSTSKRQFEIFHGQSPSAPTSPTVPTVTRQVESPIKKTRSTPRRPLPSIENDENLAPSAIDSPASRTRSRVRAASSAAITSPIQALRLTANTSRVGIEELVGDGRGTLTMKKGRAVAQLIRDGDVTVGDVLGDVSEAYGAGGRAPAGFETQRR